VKAPAGAGRSERRLRDAERNEARDRVRPDRHRPERFAVGIENSADRSPAPGSAGSRRRTARSRTFTAGGRRRSTSRLRRAPARRSRRAGRRAGCRRSRRGRASSGGRSRRCRRRKPGTARCRTRLGGSRRHDPVGGGRELCVVQSGYQITSIAPRFRAPVATWTRRRTGSPPHRGGRPRRPVDSGVRQHRRQGPSP
jgi:hypothetical protein